MSLEEQLCNHIAACRYEDLPPEAIKAAKVSILDTIGSMLASTTNSDDCVKMAAFARQFGGTPESTVQRCSSMMPNMASGSKAEVPT